MPECSEILANLGKAKIFPVVDLKSGFHQIPRVKCDREKTVFSINNGKFEFKRLPFGLKNAPAIFQRTLDDILRKYIGKFCYVYIDDIIIFSENEDSHFKHIDLIFQTLEEANMKVQLTKCNFFRKNVEYFGFNVSPEGIHTSKKKVQAISEFRVPKTLKELRSFLGLSGFYRRFIRDYAKTAKPLTSILRGEEGRISKNKSRKLLINFSEEALNAFKELKTALTSRDVLLHYPQYNKPFDLTTDASYYAMGAVLSQENKPISFISRTLSKTEETYAANEKEMLAIIWTLSSFRNYLYGTAEVNIFTDHQSLTGALSNKNHNAKMKRWKAKLEEYNYKLYYKPGKENVVADALSRAPTDTYINSTATQHSADSSSHNAILHTDAPINAFHTSNQ